MKLKNESFYKNFDNHEVKGNGKTTKNFHKVDEHKLHTKLIYENHANYLVLPKSILVEKSGTFGKDIKLRRNHKKNHASHIKSY